MSERLVVSTTLLAGLVVSALMHTGQVFSFDLHRIVQLFVLLIAGITLLWTPQTLLAGFAALGRREGGLIGVAFILGALSSLLSARPHFAGLEWALFMLLFALALTVSQEAYRQPPKFDQWMRWALAIIAVVIALKILLIYLTILMKGVKLESPALFYEGFTNRRFFGQIATLVIPLLAYPLLRAETGQERFFWRVMLAVWWALLLASATRGSFMALAAASIVLVMLNRQSVLPWLRTQAICLVLGLVIYSVLFIWIPEQLNQAVSMENRVNNFTSLSKRDVIWQIALQHIMAHPFLGIGPMHFANEINPVAAHPHNALLQLAAEWGMPVAMAWLWVAIIGSWAFLQKIRRGEGESCLTVPLAVALLGGLAQSMVDGVIVVPYTQLWLTTVIAWTIGVNLRASPALVQGISIRATHISRAMITLAIGLLVWGAYPEILSLEAIASKYRVGMVPRFWVQGWFEYQ